MKTNHCVSTMAAVTLLCATTTAAHSQEIVKIGVAGPLTGNAAEYGKDIENGVRLAVDEANAKKISVGGKAVQFAVESLDDQADPRVGVQVAQQFVDDKVAVIIGHFNSGTTIPASRLYTSAGIPMITPAATNPAITRQGSQTVFSVIATDAQNAGRAGAYAVNGFKAKRIAIMDDRTAFGQGAADEFEKAVVANHGLVVDHEFTNDKAVEFSAQLTHIKESNADLLFFSGLNPQAAMVAKRMKQLGMKTQFVGGGGVVADTFMSIAGSAGEGAAAVEYGVPVESSTRGAEFEKTYKSKYGGSMLPYAAFAYDATWISIKAMQAAGTTSGAELAAKLHATDYDGVTGKIQFASDGSLLRPRSTLYRVKDGQWMPATSSEQGDLASN